MYEPNQARQAAALQRQIDRPEAESTDRGLVLVLGDVLFTTGSSTLQNEASDRLDKLVTFLDKYQERRVLIEGHTDNVGSFDHNKALSRRRAESVRSYLVQHGIESHRLTAVGIGPDRPIAHNESATGRQLNRRVEIIIEDPSLAISGVPSRH
jgi:outer membrane protein OmpA-like peptidoglycan-associated protein